MQVDNRRNWKHRKEVPWKHIGPLLLSWFNGERGPVPKRDTPSTDDPNYDLSERLTLTRKYHAMFGSNQPFWGVMDMQMRLEIEQEEERRKVAAHVRSLHKGKATAPRRAKAK